MTIPTFITGNQIKLKLASTIWSKYNLEFEHQKIEVPEIQSDSVQEVAEFSAKWAAKKLQKPVIVNDVGYYIKALNGFPGPYIKYINQWLTSANLLSLMAGQENRDLDVLDVLAYCEPDKEPVIFTSILKSKLALKAEGKAKNPFDEILIRPDLSVAQSLINEDDAFNYWVENVTCYHELAKYLNSL